MREVAAVIYTDGSCLGNPGPGGWGAIVKYQGETHEASGGASNTTNNRMELMAALNAINLLNSLPAGNQCSVRIHSDSQYLVKAFTDGWLQGWRMNGWTRNGATLKNVDIWKSLYLLTKNRDIEWVWVKGHNGNKDNERCDALAAKAAERYQNEGDVPHSTLFEDVANEGDPFAQGEQLQMQEPVPDPVREQLPPPTQSNDLIDSPRKPVGPMAQSISDEKEVVPEKNAAVAGQPETDGQDLLECLQYLLTTEIHMKNTGLRLPCGNYQWCEHCESLNDVTCCARAYLAFFKKKREEEEMRHG